MLVLSRKLNQSIVIGDSIEVMVVDIKGDQIKVGILAPKSVKVFRKEVYDDIVRANRDAAVKNIGDISALNTLLKTGEKKNPSDGTGKKID
ncbi:MAG: carbon storage regulator CsrA [Spirochaetota bacterium]